jgi:hypothetical protein
MSEYRITPIVLGGYKAFKLERLVKMWPIGCTWAHVAHYISRPEAEQTIVHLSGPIVRVVTEG